jgi:hypothetical protein
MHRARLSGIEWGATVGFTACGGVLSSIFQQLFIVYLFRIMRQSKK